MIGVVNGLIEWLFAFPQRLSVTISNADRLIDMPREELAQAIWQDVCKAAGICGRHCRRGRSCASAARPSRRRRSRMPSGRAPRTDWDNLFLAGDWTDTGLPATIEGSIRSGDRAAELVLAMRQA